MTISSDPGKRCNLYCFKNLRTPPSLKNLRVHIHWRSIGVFSWFSVSVSPCWKFRNIVHHSVARWTSNRNEVDEIDLWRGCTFYPMSARQSRKAWSNRILDRQYRIVVVIWGTLLSFPETILVGSVSDVIHHAMVMWEFKIFHCMTRWTPNWTHDTGDWLFLL